MAGKRAFIPIGPDEVAAISLESGRLLWSRAGVGRPVAATAVQLLALDRDGRQYVFRVIDGETGHQVSAIREHGLPDWAASVGLARDAIRVTAAEAPDGIRVDWSVRQRYRGGAPPSAGIASQSQDVVRGVLVVDPTTGEAHTREPEAARPAAPVAQSEDELTSTDADVIALAECGGRVFTLRHRAQADGASLEVEARRQGEATPLWQTTVKSQEHQRPPQARP